MDIFRKDDRLNVVPDCRPMCALMEPVDWYNLKEALKPGEQARFTRIVNWIASRRGGPYVRRVTALSLANHVIAAMKEKMNAGCPGGADRSGRAGYLS